ncbi:hypothetical protein S83_039976 [Arachis hypogaea]
MLTKSVIPAACFKATEESHPTSSATAVAVTKVQSSSFQASSLSIGVMDDDLLLMVCSGVCSGGNGSTSSYYQSQKLERPVEHTRSSFWVQRRWFLAKLSRKIMLFRFHSLGGSLFRYEARFFPNHTPAEGSTVAMAFGKGSKKAAITQNPKLHRGRTTL